MYGAEGLRSNHQRTLSRNTTCDAAEGLRREISLMGRRGRKKNDPEFREKFLFVSELIGLSHFVPLKACKAAPHALQGGRGAALFAGLRLAGSM